MTQARKAGVLMHITSLPEGNLGPDAYRFINHLVEMEVSVWQILPVNLPHDDQSPYQSVSAHAGHIGMISVTQLLNEGWCASDEVNLALPALFSKVMMRVQSRSASSGGEGHGLSWSGFARFCQTQQYWLEDFALFMALREQHGYQSWNQWPESYRMHDSLALEAFEATHEEALTLIKFAQYIFFQQWTQLKMYANQRGVKLFGDIPIFVSYDSVDVWAHPEWFKLDADLNMTVVAGVPPDYFSVTGQRWGNPHYNWDLMQQDGFSWWLGRIETQSRLFDIVRVDHFRGLQAAWEIPVTEPTAINGYWQPAPGHALLQAIIQTYPQLSLVAEDLGIITDDVDALRHAFHLPGMKILQFAFGSGYDNPYLPENIEVNSVAYTGTHDNDTTLGWYKNADENARAHLHDYLQQTSPDMPLALMRIVLNTAACLAVVPIQDILGLDESARMNTPGTSINNWTWRMHWEQLSDERIKMFKQMVKESGRGYD
jgi:4-alpha-glucanotransferase